MSCNTNHASSPSKSFPKRRKLDNEALASEGLIHDINTEVDLEIAMRQQLTQTLEARIAWGLLLQESIQNGNGSASHETFRNVAMDVLLSLETPSQYILSPGPTPPSNTSNRIERPSPRKIYPVNFKPKPSFLYTRSNLTVQQEGSYDHLYLLRCPGCSKTTFTSLQGLLNHARLTHSLEWGTHDACIRACAVLDNDLDEEAGIEVGTGPSGVLPGLQTIFQMAVGGGQRLGNDRALEKSVGNEAGNGDSLTDGSHLNQTLGLHEDSPSLAPFLRKEAIRRQIKVWDDDAEIDLENSQETDYRETKSLKRLWRMSFAPRNLAESPILQPEHISDESIPAENVNKDMRHSGPKYSVSAPIVPEGLIPQGSRFRFFTRIVITDRSLSIPEDQRPDGYKTFTHKWMISIDAPSYANHITSVLNGIRVAPSDSTFLIPIPPPTTSAPFVVVGVSDRSFLATVELSFSGTSSDQTNQDQKVLFEHWVDLDPIGGRGVVVGQDQVLDVELDKNTVLKPPNLGYVPIDSRSHWNQAVIPRSWPEAKPGSCQVVVEDASVSTAILTKLTKRFPMTQGSRPPNLTIPYRLVASQSYFKTLVLGRRKAIEWGRARAIQTAYNEEIQNLKNPALLRLTVAHIYSWLLENSHFIEVTDKTERIIKQENSEIIVKEEENNASRESKHWCKICGIHVSIHPMHDDVKMDSLDDEEPKPKVTRIQNHSLYLNDTCAIVPRVLQIAKLPKINVPQLMVEGKERLDCKNARSVMTSPAALVSVADPRLILYIRRSVENLGLSRFRPVVGTADDGRCSSLYPLDKFGKHRWDAEKNLAPYGLLALVTKSFVRVLVERGLEVANRDKILSTSLSSSKRPRVNRKATEAISKTSRMLTPTHILSGTLTRGRGRGSSHDPLDIFVLLCLSKLGVTVDPESLDPSRQGELEPLVKSQDHLLASPDPVLST